MIIRTTVESDLDTIHTLIADQSVNTVTRERYDEFMANGQYRHAWSWVAEQDGRIVALAIWWGMPQYDHPFSVDGLYFVGDGDPVPVWAELIRHTLDAHAAEGEQPEYHIFVPNGWREQPEVVAALELRLAAAARAGLSEVTERLRYEWLPEYGLPARSTRLRFEPADDEAFLAVFVRVIEGSLDAATVRAVAQMSAEASAKEDLEVYRSMPGERDWWRLGYDEAGELVGFVVPTANNGGPVIGYLGVLAEHRGHRYSDDLLAEGTHVLVGAGAERIRADTDLTNRPMAACFERLGYRNHAVRMVASFPVG
ncbi:GCN5-related N-acetyltransferase [Kribbella flavida DSM 17836]|uniref:GCN5-related N-acetyltransferase n=1 Tax=Kribbella flavida (strain DSM 17836 / JCM 10339 / NBRC 14399) TaxID=479435 RepID=D2PST9_KRIFD|nr:GNAT family N-acetyltransferase [Kribbella flavida]ADB34991.1 GCN5-related N-acetyltransferase [Kribbella flavida DSM 17836]